MKAYFLAGLFTIAASAPLAASGSVVFTGSSGSLSASASFDKVGTQLKVVLTNTSAFDVLVPVDVLTALFFNIAGNPALTRSSGISGGPTFLGTSMVSGAGTVVGGEWAYLNGLAQYSANSGISSVGLSIFGPGDLFPGPNLSGPVSPDGLQYGLTSAGDNSATGNAAILGNELTKNSVTFFLDGFGAFSLSQISSVTFQYGTALDEGHFGGGGGGGGGTVPEPMTLALFGLGALGMAEIRRRAASK